MAYTPSPNFDFTGYSVSYTPSPNFLVPPDTFSLNGGGSAGAAFVNATPSYFSAGGSGGASFAVYASDLNGGGSAGAAFVNATPSYFTGGGSGASTFESVPQVNLLAEGSGSTAFYSAQMTVLSAGGSVGANLYSTTGQATLSAGGSASTNLRSYSSTGHTMSNSLTKIVSIASVIPGNPGSPGSPGQPYIPPHYYTRVITRCNASDPVYMVTNGPNAGYTVIGIPPPPPATYVLIGYTQVCRQISETLYDPGQPYIPPTLPIPFTPTELVYDYKLGWNGGARSASVFSGNVELDFYSSVSNIGAVIGLSQPSDNVGVTANEIDYAVHLDHGNFRVLEKGVAKTGFIAFVMGDKFSIVRLGDVVTYQQNGSVIYTSMVYSTSVFLIADSSFYSGGDYVYNVSEVAPTGAEVYHGGAATALARMSGLAGAGFSNYSEGVLRSLAGSATGRPLSTSHAVLSPLTGYSHRAGYSDSRGLLKPLTGYSEQTGISPSSYALTSVAFLPLMGSSHGYTGIVGESAGTLRPLTGMSSDRPYGDSRAVLSPLISQSYEFPPLGNHLQRNLFKITLEADASSHPTTLRGNLFKIGLAAYGGATLKENLFKLQANFAGTNNPVGRLTGSLFKLTEVFSATVQTSGVLRESLVLSGTLSAQGGANLPDGNLFKIQGLATGTRWTTSGLSGNLFRITSSGTASVGVFGGLSGNLFSIKSGYSALRGEMFSLLLGASGTVGAAQNVTYAVNIRTGEVTTYSNYHFNQIVRLNGHYYGITNTAIYLLEGNTDDGTAITSSVKTHPMDFDVLNYKRIPYVYVGSDDPVQVTSYTDKVLSGVYLSEVGKKRVKMSRGPRSRYWQIQINNVAGGNLKLDSLDLLVETLSRKAGG